ncbi:tRNA (34-2'-O)-methyltransferase regulator RTT10 Ecym_2239 [Eremothecium cymbalariae DBVPG|uniref:Uncharacterized protein n=1 Tax=Eremothecium cymbalariae (strain CBS 270.75 / DBVPG 7215 / KCTC 17166 / NRRL Y-17582) TaxID=931890 RepID=G8JPN1_ERECY|nr:Hypothetical protein Ecym_2239 [Eremothecium cymbalariae DBVPG\
MSLVKISHSGPSIAVKFEREWCIVGYGPYINIFNYHTGVEVNQCQVFHKNKVHGISISGERVLIYGSRSVCVVEFDKLLKERDVLRYEKLNQEWIISGEFSLDGESCYLLTSYNKVLVINLCGTILDVKFVYGERSLLYSGSIKVTPQKIYVNAGTVMSGVIIWTLHDQKKLHALKGHEGSIFAVTMSEDANLVASCSDDRSIKLWNLHTGQLLSTVWGHTARIWSLKIFQNGKKVISVSEDCTCRVWDVLDNELVECDIYNVHSMKSVWGVDVQENDMIAATSGNDGKINLIDLCTNDRHGDELTFFSVNDIAECGIQFTQNEIIKGFYCFEFGIIAVTSEGQILRYLKATNDWVLLLVDKRLKSYSLVSGIEALNVLIISSNISVLLLLSFDLEGNISIQKEYKLLSISKSTNCLVSTHYKNILVVVESPNPRDPLVCLDFDSENLDMIQEVHFTKPLNFASSSLNTFEDYILIGSRFGTLAVFDIRDVSYDFIIRNICPGDTTTSLTHVGNSIFSVTNRDGYMNFLSVDFSSRSYKLVHSNKISKGFLEGGEFNSDGDYIIYGFKSNSFYIYNETKQLELATEICGGAHRQWKLCLFESEYMFCFIKASTLYIRKFYKSSFPRSLKNGIHGREIRDISIMKEHSYNNGYLFATASEDSTIKLNHFDPRSGNITIHWTERQHVGGMQRCKFINNNFLVSCGAKEELFLWEITESPERPYIDLNTKLPFSSNNPDLRIMDFSYLFIESTKKFILATVYSDSSVKIWVYQPKTKEFQLLLADLYTSCCILNVSLVILSGKLYLLIAPTDGHLVLWDITNYIPFEVNRSRLVDNNLDVFTLKLPEYCQRIKVHQSGIKALDLVVKENGFTVYTGGDDNALGISSFKIADGGTLQASVVFFEPNAASSTITSVHLIRNHSQLLVTSVDQIIRVWSIVENRLTLIEKQYTTVADTGSSDFIDLSDDTYILIGGVGLSAWNLKN